MKRLTIVGISLLTILITLFVSCEMEPNTPTPPITYIVTFNTNGGNSIQSLPVTAGGQVSEPQGVTREGYTLSGWYSNEGLTVPYNFTATVTADITLYAKWSQNQTNIYTVTFDKNGGDTESSPQTKTITVPATTIDALPTPPTRSGYDFSGWYTQPNGGDEFTTNTTVSNNITIYAKWTAKTQTDITYTISQVGGVENTTDTTGISFTFSESIDSLNVTTTDITIGGTAAKGSATFTGSGTSWTLSPITVSSGGTATVSINKTGIETGTKNITVHKYIPKNIEPSWLPESLKGLHSYNGTWTRNYTSSEKIIHTNFTSVRDFVDELIDVIHPGYIGIEGAPTSSTYGAAHSYFQSVSIKPENAESICTYAKTYATGYYADYLTLKSYLDTKDSILYSFLYTDNSMDENVYKPYSTVSQVSSHLWIYAMDNGTACISVDGDVRHGSAEKTYLKVAITIGAEKQIGYKSGYIYTFTPDDGTAPTEYDLRTTTYF